MPGPLLQGDVHNPEGYFERADVTDLQEQLLIDFERWWPSPRGMLPLPDGWLESGRGQQALWQLIGLLEPDVSHTPWAIKDPRCSLLLPLWKAACEHLGIPLQLLLAVRDPREVVVSLVDRDQAATGMDGWRAQRLWWHHNRCVLRDACGLPLQVVHFSHWFDPQMGLQQLKSLVPHREHSELRNILATVVKPQHRRSHRRVRPCRLHPQLTALDHKLRLVSTDPNQRQPVLDWLTRQPVLSEVAPPIRRRGQIRRVFNRLCRKPVPNRVANHPWGYLAELAAGSQGPAAEHQLLNWIHHGFTDQDWQWISALPGPQPRAECWQATVPDVVVQVRGCDLQRWSTHAWAQHCPIDGECSLQLQPLGEASASAVAINLGNLEPGVSCARELLQLAAFERVWDPNPARVQLLRQFGVNASCLQPQGWTNRYLQPHADSWERCAEQLGLAAPISLANLGTTLCLGSGGPSLDRALQSPLLGVPGFNGLNVTTPEHAHLLALWLQGCLSEGLELVRLCVNPDGDERDAWRALVQPKGHARAPILWFPFPLSASELQAELDWYRHGCPDPVDSNTPSPDVQLLFEHAGPLTCEWAVCISLHNYSVPVVKALDSVLQQRVSDGLELIVVDDASSDDGASVVQEWMQHHFQRFARCLLLQHTGRGGLAAARNTAFSAAQSPWCFVLDADNTLDPFALAHCGALAASAGDRCAVIHSLIRVHAEPGCTETRSLVSYLPWQRELFKCGNYIDAMALVRRSAWHAVGGYVHSDDGWEDFDFWCTLIEADWHGILCPEVLATYTSHASSMTRSSSLFSLYRVSRWLQSRHPWLDLPRARDLALWPAPLN